MEPIKDASDLFEFERLTHHLERPGFRITELQVRRPSRCSALPQ